MNWKLQTVFVLAWIALLPSLLLGETLGQLKLVLGLSGATLAAVFAIGKGIELEAPKFLAARRRLTLILVSMVLGAVIASTGALEVTIQASNPWGTNLEIIGIASYVIGAAAIVLVLLIAPSEG